MKSFISQSLSLLTLLLWRAMQALAYLLRRMEYISSQYGPNPVSMVTTIEIFKSRSQGGGSGSGGGGSASTAPSEKWVCKGLLTNDKIPVHPELSSLDEATNRAFLEGKPLILFAHSEVHPTSCEFLKVFLQVLLGHVNCNHFVNYQETNSSSALLGGASVMGSEGFDRDEAPRRSSVAQSSSSLSPENQQQRLSNSDRNVERLWTILKKESVFFALSALSSAQSSPSTTTATHSLSGRDDASSVRALDLGAYPQLAVLAPLAGGHAGVVHLATMELPNAAIPSSGSSALSQGGAANAPAIVGPLLVFLEKALTKHRTAAHAVTAAAAATVA